MILIRNLLTNYSPNLDLGLLLCNIRRTNVIIPIIPLQFDLSFLNKRLTNINNVRNNCVYNLPKSQTNILLIKNKCKFLCTDHTRHDLHFNTFGWMKFCSMISQTIKENLVRI